MGEYIEVGIGIASGSDSYSLATAAASEASKGLHKYSPSLAIVFSSGGADPDETARGVASVVGRCPMIGSSSAGDCSTKRAGPSVAVTLLASPHLSAEVGVGCEVSTDWEHAVGSALPKGSTAAYFREGPKLGRPYYFKHPATGLSPLFVLLFTPGKGVDNTSRSYEIHDFLKHRTLGRVPIVGGVSSGETSSDAGSQIANGCAYRDAVVMAIIETDLLFGVGVSHGFRPTRRRMVVTRAEGDVIHEIDEHPAAEVYADLVGVTTAELQENQTWFTRNPFGVVDAFGHHGLLVPERVVGGRSLQFGWVVESLELLTLMQADADSQADAARDAVRDAYLIGHVSQVKDPGAVLLFAWNALPGLEAAASRQLPEGGHGHPTPVPISCLLTSGEYGVTREGLPIICSHSVVALLIGDQLEPHAVEVRKRANSLRDIEARLAHKNSELDSLRHATELVMGASDLREQLPELQKTLARLTGASRAALHLQSDGEGSKSRAAVAKQRKEPHILPMVSLGKTIGSLQLEGGDSLQSLDVAASIADLIADGIHRMQMENTINEQAREIDTAHAIAQEILSATNYRSALERISERIVWHVQASSYSLWIGGQSDDLVCEATTDSSLPAIDGVFSAQAVARNSIDRGVISGREHIALPLSVNERVNGALVLTLPRDEHLPGEGLKFLAYLAMPLGVMVEIFVHHRESTLIREIHHRVKNNLQIIASLLGLQIRRLSEPRAREALEDSYRRIMSIAAVHEVLCGSQLDCADAAALIRSVSESVLRGISGPNQRLSVDVEASSSFYLSSRQSTNLAVIVNELLGNALKHGVRGRETGKIVVRLTRQRGKAVVTVSDDGGRLPRDFSAEGLDGLGLRLVRSIVEGEFGGDFTLEGTSGGTVARLSFPVPKVPGLQHLNRG